MSVQWYHAVAVPEDVPGAIETCIYGEYVHYPSMVEIDTPTDINQQDIIMYVDGHPVRITHITDCEI